MNQNIENLDKDNLIETFKRLKRNTRGFSDLIVRDPLDFLDFEVELDSNLDSIAYEVNSGKYHPQKPYFHLSAKSKGINRPTMVFDIKDSLIYRFCIEQIEDELLKETRQKNIRGGIKITANKNKNGDDYYEKWFDDWMEHNKELRKSLETRKYLVITDIASYFENVNILILRDLVRSDIHGKGNVLNLLFYFLENIRFRYLYEVNTYNGLPQESIDCSRVLAYYFLKSHDEEMAKFCKENENNDVEFFRFVDDMSIATNSEVIGKKALKRMTESLRRLNLVASIEKTSILESNNARMQLFFEENDRINDIEERLLNNIKNGQDINAEIQEIKDYYSELKKKQEYKNWIKILKRFYTICMYASSNFFLPKLSEHIIKYPDVFSDLRIGKYLIKNQRNRGFKKSLNDLIDYLYSDENLYPALESNLIETFLLINPDVLNKELKDRFKKLCNDVFFHQSGYSPLSYYVRALACLMLFRYDNENIERIAEHYLKSSENDYLLKKYIIFVSLTTANNDYRKKILDKAKGEEHPSISRIVNFIENINQYKNDRVVKNYIKEKEIFIYSKPKDSFVIKEEYLPIRSEILEKLILIYSKKEY